MGYGPRSDAGARHVVSDMFGHEVVALELADERFYHMDTALCPLSGGEVMYLPAAFTPAGLAIIRDAGAHVHGDIDVSGAPTGALRPRLDVAHRSRHGRAPSHAERRRPSHPPARQNRSLFPI